MVALEGSFLTPSLEHARRGRRDAGGRNQLSTGHLHGGGGGGSWRPTMYTRSWSPDSPAALHGASHRRDLLNVASDAGNRLAGSCMTTDPIMVKPSERLSAAIELMRVHGITHLLVGDPGSESPNRNAVLPSRGRHRRLGPWLARPQPPFAPGATSRPPFGRIVCGVDGGSRSSHWPWSRRSHFTAPAPRWCSCASATGPATVRPARPLSPPTAPSARSTRPSTPPVENGDRRGGGDPPGRRSLPRSSSTRHRAPTCSWWPATAAREPGNRARGHGVAAVHRAHRCRCSWHAVLRGAVLRPERILVATDGSADAERAVELTARIGHRLPRERIHAQCRARTTRRSEADRVDAVDLTAELGHEPGPDP